MKINIESKTLLDIIINKLKLKQPYLITRFGDGELMAHSNNLNDKIVIQTYNRHLGYLPNNTITYEISKKLEETVYNSDVISIHKKNEMFLWSEIPKLYENLKEKNKIMWGEKLICDHDFHFYLLEHNLFDEMIQNTEHLSLITCRDVETKFKKKYSHLKTITTYKIPAENKFEEDSKIVQYYPNVFNNIQTKILSKNHSGHLLLLGGGFVGKKLGDCFKQSGGVSVDIGSVFDLWVGKVTRGHNRGSHSYIKPLL